jgi:hypothetical protein
LTGSKEGSKFDLKGRKKGVFKVMMDLPNSIIVITNAVGIIALSLLLLLVGVVDLRRMGPVMA